MKAKFLLIFLFICLVSRAKEERYATHFKLGNEAYEAGSYDSALNHYSTILKNGVGNLELYYNLGNTYYKIGDNTSAILYYEKALKLAPDDKDTKHNLEVLNASISDKITPVEDVFFRRWWINLVKSMSVDSWAWIFIICLSCSCFLIGLFMIGKNTGIRQFGFIGSLCLGIITLVVLGITFESKTQHDRQFAIIFRSTLQVKSEPSQKSTVQFVLHEGLKVETINERDDWTLIELSDGMSGWVPSLSIQKI